GWDHLMGAMTTIESGTAVNVRYPQQMARAVAIHEAGHATAGHVYKPNVGSSRLSIRMRGEARGHHQSFQREERVDHSWQSEDFGDLIHTLGSMAAELVFYKETSSGVGGDLSMVSTKAAIMVGAAGMRPLRFELDGSLPDGESEEEAREKIMKRFEKIGL